MEYEGTHVVEHAEELLSAALQLADSAAVPSTAPDLSAALARVGEALDALSLTLARAPRSLVPDGDRFEPGPSYGRRSQLLCSLYEAGATLRLSRRACARANDLLVDVPSPGDRSHHAERA